MTQTEIINGTERKCNTCDKYCSGFTKEEQQQFSKILKERQEAEKKQVITLRLSTQAVNKAKSLGKGYTCILSRILENVLTDNERLKQNL